MKKRALTLLLALVLCLSCALPAFAADTVTQEQAYQSMIALKSEYPEGMRWTNDDYYPWNGGIYSGGYGCAGFAFLLSDAAFGYLPARMVTEVSFDDVRVGDVLRVNNDSHSVIVLEVKQNHVVIAEGNYNSSIHWGRTMTRAQVEAANYLLTRYPEPGVYQITLIPEGGTVSKDTIYTDSSGKLSYLPRPTRSGYTFKGWYTEPDGEGEAVTTGYHFTKDLVLYAHWASTGLYTITFDANGGTVNPTTIKTSDNKLYALPIPTRPGYTFTGWYTRATGGTKVTLDTTYGSSLTLYAHWESNGDTPPIPATGTAHPSRLAVEIDGKRVEFEAYALLDANGYPTNYVKVRDLAYAINGTKAQFAVEWNAEVGKADLVAGKTYTANGSENNTPFNNSRPYSLPQNATCVNGVPSDLAAFMLFDDNNGGYTYFQLRDLGRKLGFNVGWNTERAVAYIETDKPYVG